MQQLQTQKQSVLLVPQTVTAGATASANLDCKGHDSVDITVVIGALAGGTNGDSPKTIKLSESNDTVASNFSDISGATANSALAASGSVRFNVDLRKRKRYLKLTFNPETNDSNDNIPVCAIAAFDRSKESPSSTSEFGNTLVKLV